MSHSYYLSLIVNIHEAYVAKIAVIAGESYTEHVVKIGEKTSTIKVPHKKKTAFTYEIDVELPPGKEMPRPFREQVEKIIEASKTPTTHHNTRTGHYQNDAWDNNTTRKSYTAAVGTAIPGVEQKEEKKESEVEKEEVVEIDFSNGNDAMMVFADILTVSNQYGSIHEVVECQDVEDLIILVEDSLEFYHGDDNKNEGRRIYLDEMKSYLISAVFDDNAVVVAADVKEAAFRILEILNSIDECKKISTQGLHSAMKSALNSLGTNAFMQLNDYKKALTAKE